MMPYRWPTAVRACHLPIRKLGGLPTLGLNPLGRVEVL